MADAVSMDDKLAAMEARLARAEQKADHAAMTALGCIENMKHLQTAIEHGHAKEGEQIAAMRGMLNMFEATAKLIFEKKPA